MPRCLLCPCRTCLHCVVTAVLSPSLHTATSWFTQVGRLLQVQRAERDCCGEQAVYNCACRACPEGRSASASAQESCARSGESCVVCLLHCCIWLLSSGFFLLDLLNVHLCVCWCVCVCVWGVLLLICAHTTLLLSRRRVAHSLIHACRTEYAFIHMHARGSSTVRVAS